MHGHKDMIKSRNIDTT